MSKVVKRKDIVSIWILFPNKEVAGYFDGDLIWDIYGNTYRSMKWRLRNKALMQDKSQYRKFCD